MLLSDLFSTDENIEIEQLSIDSRMPMRNCIFFCLSGIRDNGHNFIKEAINNGATVIVYQEDVPILDNAIFIKVNNVADCLNDIAPKFYGYPSNKIKSFLSCGSSRINVITYILYNLLKNKTKVASIGVDGVFMDENHLTINTPTLTILDNQKYLANLVKNNFTAVCMEADPLSISYKKIDAVKPNYFIYNLTNEYSRDYEKVEVNYYDIICSYLYTLDDDTCVILNKDDVAYGQLVQACGKNTVTFGFDKESDFYISDLKLSFKNTAFSLTYQGNSYKCNTKLIGLRNVYYVTAALVALTLDGYDLQEMINLLNDLPQKEGNLENIDVNQGFTVIVDQANNQKSMIENYRFARKIMEKDKRLFVLLGINSSLDDIRLLQFLKDSEQYADHIIITEKNTFYGDMSNVINKYKSAVKNFKPLIIANRKIAIESGIELLNQGDVFYVFGKGDEKFIIRNMGREEYEGDSNIVKNAISKRLFEEKLD